MLNHYDIYWWKPTPTDQYLYPTDMYLCICIFISVVYEVDNYTLKQLCGMAITFVFLHLLLQIVLFENPFVSHTSAQRVSNYTKSVIDIKFISSLLTVLSSTSCHAWVHARGARTRCAMWRRKLQSPSWSRLHLHPVSTQSRQWMLLNINHLVTSPRLGWHYRAIAWLGWDRGGNRVGLV